MVAVNQNNELSASKVVSFECSKKLEENTLFSKLFDLSSRTNGMIENRTRYSEYSFDGIVPRRRILRVLNGVSKAGERDKYRFLCQTATFLRFLLNWLNSLATFVLDVLFIALRLLSFYILNKLKFPLCHTF